MHQRPDLTVKNRRLAENNKVKKAEDLVHDAAYSFSITYGSLINSTYITVLKRIRFLYVFIGNWVVARTYLTARNPGMSTD